MTPDSPKGPFLDESEIAIGSRANFVGVEGVTPKGSPTIVIRSEGAEVTISPGELLLGMISYAKAPIQSLVSGVIGSLLHNYEFLGHQMNLQVGNISESDFATISLQYKNNQEHPDVKRLKQEIDLLYSITGAVYTSDQLSLMLGCSIDEAEEALELLLAE